LPLAARGQQAIGVRRIGVLAGAGVQDDQVIQSSVAKFREGLAKLDWMEGRNLQIDLRFSGINADRKRAVAAELVRLAPDVIVTETAAATRAVQLETQAIPIIVTGAGDVAANGAVKSLAHPESNITRVTNLYASIGAKWLELLKEAAPAVQRVALIRREIAAGGPGETFTYIPSIEDAARLLAVQVIDTPCRSALDIVRAIDAFAAKPSGGLMVLPHFPGAADRETIHQLAVQHRLPAISGLRQFAIEGGLMTYGSVNADLWRLAASFVDRILRGAEVAELPIELPTKLPLVINLKAANAIGLEVPESLLLRADEVIA
jgi:putative ABC transport system substrate-binding protein